MAVNTQPGARRAAGVVGVIVGLILAATTAFAMIDFVEAMRFAADMAKKGSWREAKFRWELIAKEYPNHRKILNNLAVASEALGDLEGARGYYEKALALGWHETIEGNYRRSERFWRAVGANGDGNDPGEDAAEPRGAPDKKKSKGKAMKVTVQLPVPARLDIERFDTLLVASFLAGESALLDINRELVRFLRGEFRKHVDLEVLPVTPPPAIPEQTLEDLIANRKFWQHLGREYDADMIVSGVVRYDRKDASGFRDVDTISPTTGQKVRRSQFVEQERFQQEMDIIFMDGATGELLFRDRLQRSATFRGTQNDPITAFYELVDSMGPDILAIVKARRQEDFRFVFKR